MKLSKITNHSYGCREISGGLFAVTVFAAIIILSNYNISSAQPGCERGIQLKTFPVRSGLLNGYGSQYQTFTIYDLENENGDNIERPSNKNLWRDIKGLGSGYVSDSWYIYSSPARLNKKSGILLGAVVVGAAVVYTYDQNILDGLQRNVNHKYFKPIRKVGNTFEKVGLMGFTNKFYIAGAAVGYIFKIKPLEEIPLQILESHLIGGGGKNVANILVGRWRPNDGNDPRKFEFNNGSSFPSGHTSSIFQVATVLSHHVNYLPATAAFYGIAGAVGLQRITSGAHWPSDVFVAAVYGTAVARAVIYLNENRKNKTSVAPKLDNGSTGLAVYHRF